MKDLTYVVITNWDIIFAIILCLTSVIAFAMGIREFMKYTKMCNEMKTKIEFVDKYFVQTDLKRD